MRGPNNSAFPKKTPTLEEQAWLANNSLCSEASRKLRAGESGVDKPLALLPSAPSPHTLFLLVVL